MYVVKDQNGNVILIATRKEDAVAATKTKLDGLTYTMEEVKNERSSK